MGDFTKAGLDRGDLEKELENMLVSINVIYRSYILTIEEYTKEELMGDLDEYAFQFERIALPLLEKAKDTRIPKLIETAKKIEKTYIELLDAIKERLSQM
ncbi:hypothetical protein [Thermocrinis sp.]